MNEAVGRWLRMFAAGAAVSGFMGLAEAGVHAADPGAAFRGALGFPAGERASLMSMPEPTAPLPVPQPSSLTPELRARGYNACYVPDTGFGAYTHWIRIGGGQMIMPLTGGHTADGGYDVVIHFHGHEAVRHAFVEVARGTVLVGIDLGNSSAPYERAFENPRAFIDLLTNVTRGLIKQSGNPHAHIRHLALSSWSAGFGAVRKILGRYPQGVDAVILLDSLHSNYEAKLPAHRASLHRVEGRPLEAFTTYAERAARGEGLFFLSHSQIVPPGYASTTEVADFLIDDVGGVRAPRQGMNPLGAEWVSGFDRRGMHVRGYLGGDKPAHCAHTELLGETVRDFIEPAWNTP